MPGNDGCAASACLVASTPAADAAVLLAGFSKEPQIYSAAHLRLIFSRLLLAEKLDVHPVHLEFFAIADEKICTEYAPPH